MDIGNSLEELLIKCNKKIYLLFRNKWIDVLDANGNLNVRVKNAVNFGIPTSSSSDGFYYNGTNVYLKAGSDIINLSEVDLPEGSIIMYEGDSAPDGWYKYADCDKFNGVIYIINENESTPTLADVILRWNPSSVTTKLGEEFTSPTLEKSVSGNVPLLINYFSSNNNIATVNASGVITPVAVGNVTIIASTEANSQHKAASASCNIIISEANINVSSVSISPSSFTINAGESKTFTASFNPSNANYQSVTWSITGDGSSLVTKQTSGLSCTITANSTINSDANIILTVNVDGKQASSSGIIKNNYVEPEPEEGTVSFGDSGIWMKHNIISDSGEEYFTYDEAMQEASKYISLGWRIPTLEDYLKLVNSVVGDLAWTNLDGKLGYLLTDENGNEVFFPARGYYYYFNETYLPLEGVDTQARYWSSTSDENNNKFILLGNLGYVLNTVTKISPNNKLTLRLCKNKNTNPEDPGYYPISVSPLDKIYIDKNGGTKQLEISTGGTWNIYCNSDWVSINPISGGEDNTSHLYLTYTVDIIISPNNTGQTRTASLNIRGTKYGVMMPEVIILTSQSGDEQHIIDINYNENFDPTSPRLTGIEGNIFNLPTLYIKENDTTYTLDNYPYKNLLNITYKFELDDDINYASVDSNTGVITLNHSTTGDGIRVGAYVNGNGIFNDCDAHFYVSILRSGVRPGQDEPLYSVGLLSDIHYATRTGVNRSITTKSDGNNSGSTTGNTYSYYLEDLNYLINNVFLNVDFIASPGDIAEYNINDFIKFTEGYKIAYNNNPKPFYCATGNHDHGIIYLDGTIKTNTRVQDSNGTEIGDHTGGRWNSITYGVTTYPCPGSLATIISGLSKSDFYSGSKSYYISYKGDMYIFMMADYGSTNGMSDVHPHNMIPDTPNSPQVTTLKSKISNYTFPDNESNLNFLYYKYEDLIKLEELLRTNSSKRIFIFSHYFFPHKAGGGNKYQPSESTELMGITFHFLNYLNNTYTNTVWFSGHTHISWLDNTIKGLHWTNTNYDYIKPTSGDNSSMAYNDGLGLCKTSTGNKIYNRNGSNKLNNNPTAWNIHLPSMSRPINTSGKQLGNCEAAIMRVYDDRVEIEKVGYSTSNGSSYTQYSISDPLLTIYNDGTGECNDTAPEISEDGGGNVPSGDGITFKIKNSLNTEVRLSGKVILNVSKSPTDWTNSTQVNANLHGPQSANSFDRNDIIILPGSTYTGIAQSITGIYMPDTNFTDGAWYFMNTNSGEYMHSVFLYSRIWNTLKNESSGSNHMYVVSNPPLNTKIQMGITINLVIDWINPEATLQPNNTGHYVILSKNNTGL